MLEFLKALDSNNIVYVSWKNNHELEAAIEGTSDLDILVPEDSYADFLVFAKDRRWVEFENPVAIFPSIKHLYCISADGLISNLHVYFSLVTGESWLKEFDFPIAKFLISQRERHSKYGLWVLNQRAQGYVFLLRHYLKSGAITSRFLYRRELASYKEEWNNCNVSVESIRGFGPIALDEFLPESGLVDGFKMANYSVDSG